MTLIKWSKQLYSNCDRKSAQSNKTDSTDSTRPSTLFPKQFKDFFSFLKFKDFSRLVLNSRPVQEPCLYAHQIFLKNMCT